MIEVSQLVSIGISGVLIPVAFHFNRSITENAQRVAKLENDVAKNYVQKADMQEMKAEIKDLFSDLKNDVGHRLDRIEEKQNILTSGRFVPLFDKFTKKTED